MSFFDRRRARLALGLAAALLAAAPAAAQQPPPAAADTARPLPTDPDVLVRRLPNGLRYYVRVNREPARRAELRLVVNAGSVLEDERQRGLAHFTEHMAFNGTRRFAKNELIGYLQSVGVQFGAHLNAYTGFDETVYILPVPTDSAAVMEKAFQILADWAAGQTFDAEEVSRERGVVIEEWRGSRGAGSRISEKQLPVLLQGSRYAEQLPIGTRESLERFDPRDLRRFYTDWYRPDLMAVVAVGDFDAGRVEELIRRNFGSLPAAQTPRPRPAVEVPARTGTRVSVVTDPEATGTTVEVVFRHAAREPRTVGDFRRTLVERLHNAMLNARLEEITQRPDAPFAAAYASAGSLVRGVESYVLSAVVKEDGTRRALEALLTEAERVTRHGFRATELERARADLLRAFERGYAEREKTPSAAFVGQYVEHFLEGSPIPGPAAAYEMARALLPGIGVEEVNRQGREWLTEDRVVLASGPETVRMPAEGELLAAFEAARRSAPAAYEDRVAAGPLMTSPPRPGRIVSEREVAGVGVREWRLSNGARVLLKPTDFKADDVVFRAVSPGGTSLLSDGDLTVAGLASLVVSVGGVGAMSQTELQKALAGKAVGVSPYVSPTEEGMAGGASPRDLETMLQLTHLLFTAPREDSTAFAALLEQVREGLRNRGASPDEVFADTLTVTMAQGHPRARPFTVERLDSVSLGRSLAFYRDRFGDAGDFTFAFVGSFDPDSLRPLVERYLASLPAAGRKESWRDDGVRPPRGVVRKTVRRGTEPKAQTRIAFTGAIPFERRELHALRSLGELLEIRLTERLREELGGTYGVSVGQGASPIPVPSYSLYIAFDSDPGRAEELARTVFAEIERLKNEDAPEADLVKVREAQRRTLETSLRENGFWLSNIVSYDQYGWDLATIPDREATIAGLDAAAIRRAARRFLDTGNYVQVTLLPEAGAR